MKDTTTVRLVEEQLAKVVVVPAGQTGVAPQHTSAPLVDWFATRARKPTLPLQLVGCDPLSARCLLQLQIHYPMIVYVWFVFWRKTATVLSLTPEDNKVERKTCEPPMHLPRRLRSGEGVEEDVEDEDPLERVRLAGHLGLTGSLNKLHLFLPPVFLSEEWRRAGGVLDLEAIDEANSEEMMRFFADEDDNEEDDREDQQQSSVASSQWKFRSALEIQEEVSNFVSWAARNDQCDVLMILVAKVNLCQLEKWPVSGANAVCLLSRAATRGNTLLVKLLVNHRLSTGIVDPRNTVDRSLYLAAAKGYKEIAEFLLTPQRCPTPGISGAAGYETRTPACVNANHFGQDTPLHAAVRRGQLHLVKVLIEFGNADPRALLVSDRAELQIAEEEEGDGKEDILRYLSKFAEK